MPPGHQTVGSWTLTSMERIDQPLPSQVRATAPPATGG
jgi:hypothetical protein